MKANEFLELHKGGYTFKSPYHKNNKKLPFNIVGHSCSEEYPIDVWTVEYRGWERTSINTGYKISTLLDFINTGFITLNK